MDMDGSRGQDGRAHDEADQMKDGRLSRDKSINNQSRPTGDMAKADGGEKMWHNGETQGGHSGMVEKCQRTGQRKKKWLQRKARDIK